MSLYLAAHLCSTFEAANVDAITNTNTMQIQTWHLILTFEAAEMDCMSRFGDQLCHKFEDANNLKKNNNQIVSCSQKVCHVSPGRVM